MEKQRKCIYLLEDNDDIREMLSFLLEEENYDVYGYPSVKLFNEAIKYGRPDVIILDVMLGDGNGIDVCDSLKKNYRTSHTPILMMSANEHFYAKEIKEKALNFISKPFDIFDFVKRIGQFVN